MLLNQNSYHLFVQQVVKEFYCFAFSGAGDGTQGFTACEANTTTQVHPQPLVMEFLLSGTSLGTH
jgi:hypothetical protein